MTNVSKRKLNKDFEQELFSQLITIFSSTSKKQNGELFSALLSPAERVMLMKRLSVVLLLEKRLSAYRIATTLHMSESTVGDIKHLWSTGKFDSIVQHAARQSFDSDKFWEKIDFILRAGLPPRGKGRWKWLDEINGIPKIK